MMKTKWRFNDVKLVYICSPLRGDIEGNKQRAIEFCKYAAEQGVIPLAPHTIFTDYLDDTIAEQRKKGLKMGIELLKRCDELWLFGDEPSSGMLKELEAANSLEIPVVAVTIQQEMKAPEQREERQLFTYEDCINDSNQMEYEGQILILRPDVLREDYRKAEFQIWKATGGFGCDPTSSGRAVYAECLYDGETHRWNRADFIGVIHPDCMPDWANDKCVQQEQAAKAEDDLEMEV
jgi:hypothetical protein